MIRSRIVPTGACCLLLVFMTGCGSSFTVSGQVTFEDQPVEEGWITFLPADGKGAADGGPIAAGRDTVMGALPGKKIVHIDAVKKVNFARSSDDMRKMHEAAVAKGDATGLVEPADIIPPNAVGNDVTIEVAGGPQTRDFTLKKPALP